VAEKILRLIWKPKPP